MSFISNKTKTFPDYKAFIWDLCENLDKNKDFSISFESMSHSTGESEKEKYLSAISLISEQKFLYEILNLPYEKKKERKSLLSDQTVKLGLKEENSLSLKNFSLQLFKYEHLIYNYDYMFSSMEFLLLIIKNYFTPMPINLTYSEQRKFIKNVLEEKKLSNLVLLKKWVKKRPKDFNEETIICNICQIFLKFLKKNEKEELVQKAVMKILKLLDNKKRNVFDDSTLDIKYCPNNLFNDDMIMDYFKFSFNKLGFKEIAKILNFIDIKLFLKMDFFNMDIFNQLFKNCDERILTLSKFFELNFLFQKKNENKIMVLVNYFELARFFYQEKNYMSLYMIIITLISTEIEKFLKENLIYIEKSYISATKDLNFYQKLYCDGFRVLKDKLNHHQNEKCPCVPLFKVYQKELFLAEKKFHIFEKKSFLVVEKILKKEKTFKQISSFKKFLVRQASIFFQGFQKNENYYFLKSYYKVILGLIKRT